MRDEKSNQASKNLTENNLFVYICLAIAVIVVLIARLHLLSFPLERDEGEYAYFGKLILDGHAPYTLAYNMKLPGTYYMYALLMGIFGESIVGIHHGLTLIVTASMFLVFLIARTFLSKIGAVMATAVFGIIGTSYTLLAQAAHATHFVVFFALIGFYILIHHYKNNKRGWSVYFLAGLFFSFAFICKQSGLFFALFGATVVFVMEYGNISKAGMVKHLALFAAGFAALLLLMILYFALFADFDRFWFWTVKYLSKYNTQVPFSEAWVMLKKGVRNLTADYTSAGYIVLWITSLIGLVTVFIRKTTMKTRILLISFFVFSFLTVVPGLYFRRHYFITLLPAAGFLVAFLFDYFNDIIINKLKKPALTIIPLLIFLIVAGSGVLANKEYLFTRDPRVSCKQVYGSNPFVESVEIAEFIKRNTAPDDKIAILGSEPQIPFYADRYSATGYIYTYNLVELHSYALNMQKEMIREIELNKPKLIIFVNVATSWLARPESEKYIFKWANEYLARNYKRVGLMDVYPNRASSLKVGDQLNNYKPQSGELIYVYERNP